MIRRKEVFKKGKQVLAMALSGAMIAGLLPGGVGGPRVVRADSGFQKDKDNTSYQVSAIKGPSGIGKWNYVYYGYNQEGKALKCRVLSMDAVEDSKHVRDSTTYNYSTYDSALNGHRLMLLDSETECGDSTYFASNSAWYDGSTAWKRLDNVWNSWNVSDKRIQSAVPRIITSKSYDSPNSFENYYDSELRYNNYLFLLGYFDVSNPKFGYPSDIKPDSSRGKENRAWTRNVLGVSSLDSSPKDYITIISEDGSIIQNRYNTGNYVYPAFCIDEQQVLFSTVVDRKKDVDYGTSFKLTVYDDNMKVNVSTDKGAYLQPDTQSQRVIVPFELSGTNTDKVEQMSVFVLKNNSLVFYSALDTYWTKEGGIGTFTLPDSIPHSQIGSTYRMYLIAEDINSFDSTDFASRECEINSISAITYIGDGTTDSITIKGGAPNDSKLTIMEPEDIIYDGEEKLAYTNSVDHALFPGTITINYYKNKVNPGYHTDKVVKPGNYAAELVYNYNEKNYYAEVNFTIMPGYSEVVTEPKAKSLKENGSAQELITKGTALHGTMLYALGDNGDTPPAVENFTSDIPTAKNAGTYYVWYMIKGDEFYRGLPGHLVTAKIDKSGNSSDKDPNEGNKDDGQNNQGENGNPPAPVAPGNTIENESASYVVTSSDAKNATVTYEASKKAAATSVTIPDTVNIGDVEYKITQISTKAFYKNKKIRKVKIGKYVTVIGNSAFYGCIALTTVSGGTGVKKIGANAFNGCKKLTKAPIGAKVTSIGDKAFYKCAGVKTMTIPVNVSKLGKQFAYGTKNLTTLTVKTIKLKDKSISAGAFKGAGSKKTKAVVPKGMKKEYTTLFRQKGGLNKKIKVKESK